MLYFPWESFFSNNNDKRGLSTFPILIGKDFLNLQKIDGHKARVGIISICLFFSFSMFNSEPYGLCIGMVADRQKSHRAHSFWLTNHVTLCRVTIGERRWPPSYPHQSHFNISFSTTKLPIITLPSVLHSAESLAVIIALHQEGKSHAQINKSINFAKFTIITIIYQFNCQSCQTL